jgi:Spy/CpxP family protein refolding chaperone
MKKHIILSVPLVILVSLITHAQTVQIPEEYKERVSQYILQLSQQRGGGGRGAAPGGPADISGAWWTNTALVQRLGLTDDQKTKLEAAYENRRQQIVSATDAVEKEEGQLTKLLEADPVDRNAVLAQIDRINQARSDLERINSLMTLDMREVLTRVQWLQLKPPQRVRVGANVMNGNLTNRVEPSFPTGSLGTVVLEAQISREGIVESANVLSGPPAMVQAAHDAVMQWRYKPTMLNGQAVAVVTTITLSFPPGAAPPAGGRGQRGGVIQTPFGPVPNPHPQ